MADRFRTDAVLWVGGGLSLIGGLILSRANSLAMVFMGMVMAMGGFFTLRPPSTALLSNSVHATHRNRVFGTQFMLNTSGWAIGNIILFFIFQGQGTDVEELDRSLIRLSLLIGTGFALAGALINLLVRDRNVLHEQDEGSVATSHSQRRSNGIEGGWTGFKARFAPGVFPIVLITLTTPFIIGFGAGTTVPFLPRFFFDVYDLDLADLSLAFAGLTIATAFWGKLSANLADRYGRIEIIVANQMVAVVLLYILASYPPFLLALCTLILRNALMNGAWPIYNSLQMEYTPRRYRSQVSALTTNSFSATFAIGQMNGGLMVDGAGFYLAFFTTATLYLVGTLMMWRIRSLMGRIPSSEDGGRVRDQAENDDTG